METACLRSLNEEGLRAFALGLGEKSYRADQLANWLHSQDVSSFDEMENLPASFRAKLAEVGAVDVLEEAGKEVSTDGTIKWLYRTRDGHAIETVLIPSAERNSVCVSTQVGCAMGCAFCRTARMGILRDLEAGEILEQFIRTRRHLKETHGGMLTNIIFMGMGEPLNNLEAVLTSVLWLHHQKHYNLARKRITVSTSGVVPAILELARRNPPLQLAISLNGSNQQARASIMPVAHKWPLDELLAAVDEYVRVTDSPVTFEYILIKDLTCSATAARELRRIIHDRQCKVNLIVLNDSENAKLQAPSPEEVDSFLEALSGTGKHVTLRQPRGRDIRAACGQLAVPRKKVA